MSKKLCLINLLPLELQYKILYYIVNDKKTIKRIQDKTIESYIKIINFNFDKNKCCLCNKNLYIYYTNNLCICKTCFNRHRLNIPRCGGFRCLKCRKSYHKLYDKNCYICPGCLNIKDFQI